VVVREEDAIDPSAPKPSLEWAQQAACQGVDTDAFYGTAHASVARAKGICHRCFVRTDCLLVADAMERDLGPKMVYGVWGGLTPEERIARRRAITRLS
jgi:hypothetical protein